MRAQGRGPGGEGGAGAARVDVLEDLLDEELGAPVRVGAHRGEALGHLVRVRVTRVRVRVRVTRVRVRVGVRVPIVGKLPVTGTEAGSP